VDLRASLVADCPPDRLFALVGDLCRYPEWLTILPKADRVEAGSSIGAWQVELRGRLGPLARSKQLRMACTERDTPHRAVFERRELDGRQHAPWRLVVDVSDHAPGAELQMHLHYGGTLGGPLLERLLREEIERSRPRLLELAEASASR
jgi:hypothetical protein